MTKRIYHVGLTVFDIERSIRFYRDVLGLQFQGEILMQGPEADTMFQRKNCRARVAYLNGFNQQDTPPVELIQFLDEEINQQTGNLFTTSISELCFHTKDAEETYRHLRKHGVECLSEPQVFDFTDAGFGKSKAFYFRDPDGIILEMMQPL